MAAMNATRGGGATTDRHPRQTGANIARNRTSFVRDWTLRLEVQARSSMILLLRNSETVVSSNCSRQSNGAPPGQFAYSREEFSIR